MQLIPLAISLLNAFKPTKKKTTAIVIAGLATALLSHWDELKPHVPDSAQAITKIGLEVVRDTALSSDSKHESD